MAVPASTYRVQLTAEFDLYQAATLCRYLAVLGVGAIYCSPVLQSVPGSTHGYDVTDHNRIDSARGGAGGWRALIAAAAAAELGVVVDIVPNHMGVADASVNAAWWDVLRLGPGSPFAAWFDIEWSHGRVLLPVLGDDFTDDDLHRGRARAALRRAPVPDRPGHGADRRRALVRDRGRGARAPALRAGQLPAGRHRAELSPLLRRHHAGRTADRRRRGRAGHPPRDPALGARRRHRRACASTTRTGWPTRVRTSTGCGPTRPRPGSPSRRSSSRARCCPTPWPVAGTTGYDALAEVNSVFIDPAGVEPFDALYDELIGDSVTAAGNVRAGKRFITSTILQAEVRRLARLVPGVPDAPTALAELLAAFATYRSYLPLGRDVARLRRSRSCRSAGPNWRRRWPTLTPAAHRPARRAVRAVPADLRRGDGQGGRRHRLLPLQPIHRAERGRRRPGEFGSTLDEFHDGAARPAGPRTEPA